MSARKKKKHQDSPHRAPPRPCTLACVHRRAPPSLPAPPLPPPSFMAKKGGLGKRGVGGKSNTRKTHKAGLRHGFEARHIDQVRARVGWGGGGEGGRRRRGGAAAPNSSRRRGAVPPPPTPPCHARPPVPLCAMLSTPRALRTRRVSDYFLLPPPSPPPFPRFGRTSAPRSTSCAAWATPWWGPLAQPDGEGKKEGVPAGGAGLVHLMSVLTLHPPPLSSPAPPSTTTRPAAAPTTASRAPATL